MRGRSKLFVAVLAAVLSIGCAAATGTSNAATGQTIFGTSTSGINVDPDPSRSVIGTQFRVAKDGTVDAVKVHRSTKVTGALTGKVARGSTVLATVPIPAAGAGWQVVDLPSPVDVVTGQTYTVYYTAPAGRYSVKSQFTWPKASGDLTAVKGVYTFGNGVPTSVYQNENYFVDVVFNPTVVVPPTTSASPSPSTTTAPTTTSEPTTPPVTTEPTTTAPTTTTTTTPPTGGWPNADNTGVPAGVTLTNYTGPNFLQDAGEVRIDAKRISYIQAYGNTQLIITRSETSGFIDINSPATLVIEDSNVNAGSTSLGAIGSYNITARRVEATGGQHSIQCHSNCIVEDSFLHDQYNPDGQGYHNNAFISNGGSNITLRHNTLHCTPLLNSTDGGCTADVSLFGDWATISDVLVENNLMKANNSSISYCAYGGYSPAKPYPNAHHVQYVDNVFERGANGKCGVYGAITSFQTTAAGNVWSGNVWDDGTVLNP